MSVTGHFEGSQLKETNIEVIKEEDIVSAIEGRTASKAFNLSIFALFGLGGSFIGALCSFIALLISRIRRVVRPEVQADEVAS